MLLYSSKNAEKTLKGPLIQRNYFLFIRDHDKG